MTEEAKEQSSKSMTKEEDSMAKTVRQESNKMTEEENE